MDINITNTVSLKIDTLTKTASTDSISDAEKMVANLSKSSDAKDVKIASIMSGLVNDIRSFKKKEKIASLVEDMSLYSQIDSADIGKKIEKLASLNNDELDFEKKAFSYFAKNMGKSNLFITKTSSVDKKRDLDSFINK